MSRQYDDDYSYDYLATQAAEAQAVVDAAIDSASFAVTGTSNGQAALWNGTAFVPGSISGDSNGVSVGVVTSPAFGLQVTLSQNLTTAGSPTFNALTLTSLLVGSGGSTVKKIATGTVSIDPGSIAAQTRGSQTATITGAAVGDVVLMQPPGALNTGLVFAGCEVTGANTVTVFLGNLTAGAIDDGSQTWRYLWIDLT